jgi:hypothetical protein
MSELTPEILRKWADSDGPVYFAKDTFAACADAIESRDKLIAGLEAQIEDQEIIVERLRQGLKDIV